VLLVPVVVILAVFLFRMAPGDIDITAGQGIEVQHQGEDFVISTSGVQDAQVDFHHGAQTVTSTGVDIVEGTGATAAGISIDLEEYTRDGTPTAQYEVGVDLSELSAAIRTDNLDITAPDGADDDEDRDEVADVLELDIHVRPELTASMLQTAAGTAELTFGMSRDGNNGDVKTLVNGHPMWSPPSGSDDQTADEVSVTAASFDGNLTSTDTNVQIALQSLDDLTILDKSDVDARITARVYTAPSTDNDQTLPPGRLGITRVASQTRVAVASADHDFVATDFTAQSAVAGTTDGVTTPDTYTVGHNIVAVGVWIAGVTQASELDHFVLGAQRSTNVGSIRLPDSKALTVDGTAGWVFYNERVDRDFWRQKLLRIWLTPASSREAIEDVIYRDLSEDVLFVGRSQTLSAQSQMIGRQNLGLHLASRTLSAADIANLDTTRIQLIASPAQGSYILPHYMVIIKAGGNSSALPSSPSTAWQNTQIHLSLASSTGGLVVENTGGPDCVYGRWLHSGQSPGWFNANDYQLAVNLIPMSGSGSVSCGRGGGSVRSIYAGSPLSVVGFASADDKGTQNTADDQTAAQVWDANTANLGNLSIRIIVYYETIAP